MTSESSTPEPGSFLCRTTDVHTKVSGIVAVAVLILAGSSALQSARAQPGITRTDLQQHDLSVAGREVVQVRVGFLPGVVAASHSHPGEEIVYVLEGSLEYRVEGAPPVTLEAGDVLFIPARAVHAVTNVGSGNAVELATYVVEKGKPLIAPSTKHPQATPPHHARRLP